MDLSQDNEAYTIKKKKLQNVKVSVPVKYLGVTHQTQQKSYYCAPASVSMIAKYLGYNVSQDKAASLLGTTTNGTDAGANVATALRKSINNTLNYEWVWHNYSDIATLRNRVFIDIEVNVPLMINTLESPGDWYIAGHNIGKALYHYGVIDGYNTYVDGGRYIDPAAGYSTQGVWQVLLLLMLMDFII